VASKLYESILKKNIEDYLNKNHFLNNAQHGFLSKHSVTTNLLSSLHDWTQAYDSKKCTNVVFVDFAKAFDAVSHPKILFKLSTLGINSSLFLSMKSFLSNRKQRVRIGNSLSDYAPVTSGVPQGSVLGPLLFLVFIDDLIDALSPHAISKAFADDIKIYKSLDSFVNCSAVQHSLQILSDWFCGWQMNLAANKYFWTRLGLRSLVQPPQAVPGNALSINGVIY